MILGAVLPEYTENGFDTLNGYVGKVVDFSGNDHFVGESLNTEEKGERVGKM